MEFKLGQDAFTTSDHNKNVTLEGMVKIAKTVTPELVSATFKCDHCTSTVQIPQGGGNCRLLLPEKCSNDDCITNNEKMSKKPKFTFLQEKSTFLDYQEIWLTPLNEAKLNLGKGQKVILKNKLVGSKQGENIRITGRLGFELKGKTNFAIPVIIASKIKKIGSE